MTTIEMIRSDTVDLDPAEFLKMREENPDAIASAQIIPPILGKSKDFGKIRVRLSKPRYEINL
jgi:hypothetical protein